MIVCLLAAVAGIGTAVLKSRLIGGEEAEAAALADAGLSPSEVSALRARLEFDDGRFVYEVDFYSGGREYEYVIQAKDGDLISRDIEGGSTLPPGVAGQEPGSQPGATGQQEPGSQPGTTGQQEPGSQPGAAGQAGNSGQTPGISLEEAKAAALADAGLAEADVTFFREKTDRDDGILVYDLEFYTSDTEYDYEIDADNGTVRAKKAETLATGQTGAPGGGVPASGAGEIGADRAREIALERAGLAETDVTLLRAELDYEDGRAEYEVEFYQGRTEYSCTVDAFSGEILEFEAEAD